MEAVEQGKIKGVEGKLEGLGTFEIQTNSARRPPKSLTFSNIFNFGEFPIVVLRSQERTGVEGCFFINFLHP
jgi:hypothetical protein